jgi:hypothetical protein
VTTALSPQPPEREPEFTAGKLTVGSAGGATFRGRLTVSPALLAGTKGQPTEVPPGPRPELDDPMQRRVFLATGTYLGQRICAVAYPVIYVGELDNVRFGRDEQPVSVVLIRLEATPHHAPHEWQGHPPLRITVPWSAIDRFEWLPPA